MRVLEFRLLALLLLPALAGCSGFSLGDKQPLGIALHYGFHGDNAEVWVDGELVYQSTVETNPVLGLAGGHTVELKEGGYLVTVRVNDEVVGSHFVILQHPLYLGIDYIAAEGQITFQVRREPIVYF